MCVCLYMSQQLMKMKAMDLKKRKEGIREILVGGKERGE